MTQPQRFETRLASGRRATVARIDVDRLTLEPLFLETPSAAEMTIATEIAMARQRDRARYEGYALRFDRMAAIPDATTPLAAPEDVDTEWGPMRLYSTRARASVELDAYRIAPLHFLRLASSRLARDELLINANHFLFLPPELEGPWNAYGDPIGLVAAAGVVETPAQLRRSCLVETAAGFGIREIGFDDHEIVLPDGSVVPPYPFGPPADLPGPRAFSRFHGSRDGATPVTPGAVDVAYWGRHPLALKAGGGMPIPTAGCAVRFASRAAAEAAALAGPITYRTMPALVSGVQTGPRIVSEGCSTRDGDPDLIAQFMVTGMGLPDDATLSPYAWKSDWDKTVAARLSAGITAEGRLFFCAVEGTSSFLSARIEPTGATLDDLAGLMAAQGAVEALHLDGGGSTQVFSRAGGALIEPRDVLHDEADSPAQYDRPLPLGLRLG